MSGRDDGRVGKRAVRRARGLDSRYDVNPINDHSTSYFQFQVGWKTGPFHCSTFQYSKFPNHHDAGSCPYQRV